MADQRSAEKAALAGPSTPLAPADEGVVLRIEDLVVDFSLGHGRSMRAVDGVSLEMRAGEILGIVGESGSGKTTMARVVAGFLRPTSGSIWLPGPDGVLLRRVATRGHRDVQMVFQQSAVSMNPRMPVWKVIGEGYAPNRWLSRRRDLRGQQAYAGGGTSLEAAVLRQLHRVGLPDSYIGKRATELSGGEKQRVVIARALAPEPVIIVCDEPVSSLDVSIRAVILNLFERLRDELGTALFFISHDISVVAHLADRVIVMHNGRAVESGPARQVIDNPRDDYTRRLIASVPRLERGDFRNALPARVPRPEPANGEALAPVMNQPRNHPA